MFEVAFSSDDDEVIADAVCAWIAGSERAPAGSLARHSAKRIERATPLFPMLRRIVIHAIRNIWYKKLTVPVLEIVRLLDLLDVNEDEVTDPWMWVRLLVEVIRSPMGFKSLSSHYWRCWES